MDYQNALNKFNQKEPAFNGTPLEGMSQNQAYMLLFAKVAEIIGNTPDMTAQQKDMLITELNKHDPVELLLSALEQEAWTMKRFLAEGEALQQVAVMGLRAPDGTVAENVPLYRIIQSKEIKPESGLTAGEEAACEDIGRGLADIYRQYKRAERKAKAGANMRAQNG